MLTHIFSLSFSRLFSFFFWQAIKLGKISKFVVKLHTNETRQSRRRRCKLYIRTADRGTGGGCDRDATLYITYYDRETICMQPRALSILLSVGGLSKMSMRVDAGGARDDDANAFRGTRAPVVV